MTIKKSDAPVVLLTGASTGIGLALAKLLLQETRFRVVVTARKSSLSRFTPEFTQLCQTQSDRFLIRPLDVTSASEREILIAEVTEQWGGVDILVNNAGTSYRSVFEHATDQDLEDQLRTNFLGPMALIRLVLPGMRQKQSGRIINVSSVGGMMAMPTMSAYSASKFALEGASEALWYEMKPWNIHVSLIQPGFIRSQSFKNVLYTDASLQASQNTRDSYHAYYQNMSSFISRRMNHALATPDGIAKRILKVMSKPHPALRVPVTIDAWFFGWIRKVLPRGIYHRLLYSCLPGVRRWVNKPVEK